MLRILRARGAFPHTIRPAGRWCQNTILCLVEIGQYAAFDAWFYRITTKRPGTSKILLPQRRIDELNEPPGSILAVKSWILVHKQLVSRRTRRNCRLSQSWLWKPRYGSCLKGASCSFNSDQRPRLHLRTPAITGQPIAFPVLESLHRHHRRRCHWLAWCAITVQGEDESGEGLQEEERNENKTIRTLNRYKRIRIGGRFTWFGSDAHVGINGLLKTPRIPKLSDIKKTVHRQAKEFIKVAGCHQSASHIDTHVLPTSYSRVHKHVSLSCNP